MKTVLYFLAFLAANTILYLIIRIGLGAPMWLTLLLSFAMGYYWPPLESKE